MTVAAWFRLAADRLEDGKVENTRNMTALGMALCEPLPRQVAELRNAVNPGRPPDDNRAPPWLTSGD